MATTTVKAGVLDHVCPQSSSIKETAGSNITNRKKKHCLMASSPPSFTVRANDSHSVQSMEAFLHVRIATFENAFKENSA